MASLTNVASKLSIDDDAEAIRVLLVVHNDLVRRDLRQILSRAPSILVAGEARELDAALLAPHARRPQVLVTDVPPPAAADLGVVLVARRIHPGSLREGLRSGALGYVVEDTAEADLVTSVRAAAHGRRFLSGAIERLLVASCVDVHESSSAVDPLAPLTPREREVLVLIADGYRPHEIGRRLGIAPTTVGTHRRSLMAKLDLHKVAQLVRFAVRTGMTS